MIVIFIALIILYLGVILFVGTTFVKISLFAMDKLAVFIASWYYTHHYFSIKFSFGYAVYFWDILAAIVAVVLYSVLFKLIHDKFGLIGKILNLAISFFSSMTVYCILIHGFITNEKSYRKRCQILCVAHMDMYFPKQGTVLYARHAALIWIPLKRYM